ncbi:hypothetical protein ABAC460_11850 [Asticcacaulis sp. AC460]|nr:hypothetical protein ABAC460_11850 [Asticcacaulis sp. AC460]
MMAALPLAFAITVIALIILGRWYFSRQAWTYHPGGKDGFLRDEFLRLGAIFLPVAVLMVAVRWYIYTFDIGLMNSPWIYAAFLSVFVFRRLAGFLPFVRDAGRRLDAARKQAHDAKVAA